MNSNVQLVQRILTYTFGIIPIVAGLDKFTNILTNWSQYVSEGLSELIPIEVSLFMILVGFIEILAGLLVLIKPKIGSYVVAAWLTLISLSLLVTWSHVDVAVRDIVMAIAAFSLAKLSEEGVESTSYKA